jgi:vancomycin resistance protein YoaR
MGRNAKKIIQIAGMGAPFLFYCLFFPLYPILAFAETEPKKQLLLSAFTTTFSTENIERSDNIALACKFLNGCKIDGKNTFSFNQRVGERTKERGFKDAIVILDGQFTTGCGGGVCQVSTTLYNAALLAGMDVTESHPHSLQVHYVPPSLDAMVSAYSDLVFYNPHATPVAIEAEAKEGELTVRFYGRGNGFTYQTESAILGMVPPLPPVECEGEEDLLLKEGKAGVKSESYLLRFRHGKLIEKRRLRRDNYAPVRGVIQKRSAASPLGGENHQNATLSLQKNS